MASLTNLTSLDPGGTPDQRPPRLDGLADQPHFPRPERNPDQRPPRLDGLADQPHLPLPGGTPISALPDWMASLTNLTSLYQAEPRSAPSPTGWPR